MNGDHVMRGEFHGAEGCAKTLADHAARLGIGLVVSTSTTTAPDPTWLGLRRRVVAERGRFVARSEDASAMQDFAHLVGALR